MADKFFSERNLKFLLYEVLDAPLLTKFESFEKHNRQIFDMMIDACTKLAKELLWPCFEEMDKKPPEITRALKM